VSLDLFVMLLAVPALTDARGATSSQQLWILDVYGFMVAGLMLTMGNVGDRIGRRRLLLTAAAAFGVASVVAAYSVNPGMLIGARAALGIAGAAITPTTLSLVSTLFPNARQRTTALGVWAGCFTVGAVIGPITGGVLLDHFWWGSAFLIGVPAMVFLLVAGPFLPAIHGLKYPAGIVVAIAGMITMALATSTTALAVAMTLRKQRPSRW
jgi:DHA2 family multidrug resistance protein-like MFS transporter